MSRPRIRHHDLRLRPDSSRVLVRPFIPRWDARMIDAVVNRALAFSEEETAGLLRELLQAFEGRHRDLPAALSAVCAQVIPSAGARHRLSRERQLLIGALFAGEYALESAALFNPSIVPHPDQDGLPAGALRIILSLRATGEGHISSIEFRTGVLSAGGELALDPAGRFATGSALHWLEGAAYELRFPPELPLGERVIFPASPDESNGIEDARFVRFQEEDGTFRYYATYTAYDGRAILPRLVETYDFTRFRMLTLQGPGVQDKGMALFPRRVDGRYAMLSRQDGENLHLMYSDDARHWSGPHILLRPVQPWESVKIGNCGSPLETPAGWLVITHGVGPMRRYCIGAALLDLADPSRVLGRLREPLLEPSGPEREGYVPNVVYSCGSLIHGKELVLPYAMSDQVTGVASVDLGDLLAALA